ncbi:cupin domain-containing protein [Synechococcus sp. J7-Johnson]|uniref:cupin domain-containing protein n=1 Tax=Synechococcus sp. J7-Johnson TaxID=2823737 RepID=UPI0020CD0B8F|nr:cupin domain-containing protein [Synechococcus sp. J7-Johnson]MCP9840336.1 cupin domain-containing protein [Synechococcus sp. J7-Johnson]
MQPLQLMDHPEGGRFLEVFRSKRRVITTTSENRCALTHIYFQLRPGECSLFHRVGSDEVWNLYQGQGLRLYSWDGTSDSPSCLTLSAEANSWCQVIPAGMWQAAEPISETVLVGCTVAPGFEFTDFQLLQPDCAQAQALIGRDPAMARFLERQP